MLQGQGFEVVKIGNASERGFSHTGIYDLTNGQKPEELKLLQDFLQADVSVSTAGWIFLNEIVPKEITVTDEGAQAQITEDNLDFLLERIKEHNLPQSFFEWYLDLRRFGSVPHSGFGLGLERTVSWICGLEHLREAIPFPRMIYRNTP